MGSPGVYSPEGRIRRLIDVKLCRGNSLPRQPANPSHSVFGVRHPDWLLHAVWQEEQSFACADSKQGEDADATSEEERSLASDFNARGWLLGVRHTYVIFKDHFVTCSRQPSGFLVLVYVFHHTYR